MPLPNVTVNVLDGGLGLVSAISRESAYRDSQRAIQLMRQELDYRLHSILLPVDLHRVQAMVQDYFREQLPLGCEARVTYDEARQQLQVNIEAGRQVYGMEWDLRELQRYGQDNYLPARDAGNELARGVAEGMGTYANIFSATEVAAENLRGLINHMQSSDRRWFSPPKPIGESLDGPRWDISGSVTCKTRYERIMEGGAYRG